MQDKYYPPNPISDLRVLIENQIADDTYLDGSGYPQSDVEYLLSFLSPVDLNEEDSSTRIMKQVEELLNDLNDIRQSIKGSNEMDEKVKYFTMRTRLLDKLTSIQERVLGLKQFSEFKQAVLKVIHDVMLPDQRTRIADLLTIEIEGPTEEELDMSNIGEDLTDDQ